MPSLQRPHSSFAEPFHEGIAQGRIVYPRCAACGRVLGFTTRLCGCGHAQVEWTEAGGDARILSHTTYRKSYSAAFATPYTVVLVALAEGPRLAAAWAGKDAVPTIGMAVRLLVEARTRLVARPQ